MTDRQEVPFRSSTAGRRGEPITAGGPGPVQLSRKRTRPMTEVMTRATDGTAASAMREGETPVTIAAGGPCPPWCDGRHGWPRWAEKNCPDRVWHLAASCPAWCIGHPDGEPEFLTPGHAGHSDEGTEVELSLAEPIRDTENGVPVVVGPNFLGVQCFQYPEGPEPVIAIQHGATSDAVSEMTPAEAVALAAALVRAAWRANPGAVQVPAMQDASPRAGTTCPPWCTDAPHDPIDIHISGKNAVDAADVHHLCSYTTGPFAEERCSEDVCAELIAEPGERPEVQLHHGDDCLPNITLSGAEVLGLKLVGLAAIGRETAPAVS